MNLIPVSVVIPTLARPERVVRTIESLLAQDCVPAEIIVVDASLPLLDTTRLPASPSGVELRLLPAAERGAAAQRNQGVAASTQPFVLFADDDVDLEPGCLKTLWNVLQADSGLGACGAVITNQSYHPPGPTMRRAYA